MLAKYMKQTDDTWIIRKAVKLPVKAVLPLCRILAMTGNVTDFY